MITGKPLPCEKFTEDSKDKLHTNVLVVMVKVKVNMRPCEYCM
jgi:hypothetical protein